MRSGSVTEFKALYIIHVKWKIQLTGDFHLPRIPKPSGANNLYSCSERTSEIYKAKLIIEANIFLLEWEHFSEGIFIHFMVSMRLDIEEKHRFYQRRVEKSSLEMRNSIKEMNELRTPVIKREREFHWCFGHGHPSKTRVYF